MRLVVDTSVLIDHLRKGIAWKTVLAEIEGRDDIELLIPTIVIFELFSGASSKNPAIQAEINNLLEDFRKIHLDEGIAVRAGELSRDIHRAIQAPDYIIAASAIEVGGAVVTLNRKHLEQIPGLDLYPL